MHKLLDLADVLRSSGAFPVVEYSGWQTRGRSRDSGNYKDAYPDHVMEHHTASNTSAANDINYICHGSGDAPLSNLYLGRDGTMHVLAAGATNTNGKGHDYWGGGVANDDMNAHAIGIEIANTGTGERYTDAQQATIVAATAALCRAYNIPIGNIRAHFEWAPDRKIDPSGPSKWAPNGGKWNMDAFRGDVWAANVPSEPPPAIPPGDDMIHAIQPFRNSDTRPFGGDGLVGEARFGLSPTVFPANTVAVAMNIAVIGPVDAGFCTVWPDGPRPDTSCVNYEKGGATNGAVVVGIHDMGFKIYLHNKAHVACDITGYWTA